MGEAQLFDVVISISGVALAVFQLYLSSQFAHTKELHKGLEKRVDNLWREHGECNRGCEHKRSELRADIHRDMLEIEHRIKDNCELRHGE